MIFNPTQSKKIRSVSIGLRWIFAATLMTLAACGGGGGGGDSPAAAPPPATPVVLNAQEELAYKSWAVRLVTVNYVEDEDSFLFSYLPAVGGRLGFAGQYPANGNIVDNNNFPAKGIETSCKDGGTKTFTLNDVNKNNILDAGDSEITNFINCKDGSNLIAGSQTDNLKSTVIYYSAPNQDAIRSVEADAVLDQNFSTLSNGYIGSVNGTLGISITDPPLRRLYTLKDMKYAFNQGSIVANTLIGINRAAEFGLDKPFTVAGFAGSVAVDGKAYTVSSTKDIPWLKTAGYFPKSGSITATAANGDKVITQFTATGAKCSLVPAGTTTASVTVEQCSKVQ